MTGAVKHEPASGLREGALVHVDVGSTTAVVTGMVVAFLGPHAMVALDDETARRRISPGARGYLMVEHDGRLQALAATVSTAVNDCLLMQITDAFRLGQRREWSRIDVRLDATLRQVASDAPPIRSGTIDLSPGGVRLLRPPGMPLWPRYDVTISGDALGDEPLEAEAVPARAGRDFVALRFTRMADADERRLVALVIDRRAAGDRPVPVLAMG
jgi:hypothetical protein